MARFRRRRRRDGGHGIGRGGAAGEDTIRRSVASSGTFGHEEKQAGQGLSGMERLAELPVGVGWVLAEAGEEQAGAGQGGDNLAQGPRELVLGGACIAARIEVGPPLRLGWPAPAK